MVLGLELLGGLETGLDLHGEIDLVGGGEEVDLADLLQVHAHRVAGEHDGGGVDAAWARAVARGAHAGLLLGLLGGHLGVGHLGDFEVVVLARLLVGIPVDLEVVVLVQAGIVVQGRILVTRGDDFDAALAKVLVQGIQLRIADVDVLESNLDLVLGDGSGALAPVEEKVDVLVESGTGVHGLFGHKFSLHNTKGHITLAYLALPRYLGFHTRTRGFFFASSGKGIAARPEGYSSLRNGSATPSSSLASSRARAASRVA